MKRIVCAAAALALLLVGCAESSDAATESGGPDETGRDRVTTSPEAGGALDGLTLTLEMTKTTLEQGESWMPTFSIENNSGRTIIDPSCNLWGVMQGIVPEDDPQAELWQAIVTDCAGNFPMPDGYSDKRHPLAFRATDMTGEPLPPGEYVAALEVQGFAERLEVPVTVVEGD